MSLFMHARVTLGMKLLVAAIWLVAVSWPAAGVLAVAVLLPLALPIEHFLGPAAGRHRHHGSDTARICGWCGPPADRAGACAATG